MYRAISCKNTRRFGVEVELNTSDGLTPKLRSELKQNPLGADKVCILIHKTLKRPVALCEWGHTHNNRHWVVKPDASCGIEVCSPILKSWRGLNDVVNVVKCFRDNGLKADNRCSFHVHVNIADLTPHQLASVIAWYIKCEHVMMDSVPAHRKISRYCQMLGTTDLFDVDSPIDPHSLFRKLSTYKYYSMNVYHFMKGGGFIEKNNLKKTIEFRIAEHLACLDPLFVKNWVRFLLHFIEVTKDRPLPQVYVPNNQWTGLSWLNPKDVFEVLEFDQILSPGLTQVKDWFVQRIYENGYNSGLTGIWSNEGRSVSRQQFLELTKVHQMPEKELESEDDMLFSKKYRS